MEPQAKQNLKVLDSWLESAVFEHHDASEIERIYE